MGKENFPVNGKRDIDVVRMKTVFIPKYFTRERSFLWLITKSVFCSILLLLYYPLCTF